MRVIKLLILCLPNYSSGQIILPRHAPEEVRRTGRGQGSGTS